jgi:hypothetical protein
LAGLLGGAGLATLPGRGSAAASSNPPRPEVLLTIFFSGGIDQTLSTDPKIRSQVDQRVHLPYTESEIVTIGDTRVGPLFRPLAPLVPKMAIVNGVVSGTVAHPTGIANIHQMRLTYPKFDRLGIGGHLARAMEPRPLEQVHFTKKPDNNELVPRPAGDVLVVNSGEHSMLQLLHEIAQERDVTRYTDLLDRTCKDCPGSVIANLMKAMRDKKRTVVDKVPITKDEHEVQLIGGTQGRPSVDEVFSRWEGEVPFWGSILTDIMFLIEHRLTRAIHVFLLVNWDTHDSNDKKQGMAMAGCAPALRTLVQELDRRNLSDRVGIVITSELGRHPFVNRYEGKDHFPEHPVMFMGPGVMPGQYGETDAKMVSVPVSLQTGRPGRGGRKLNLDDVGASILRWFGVGDARRLGYLGTPLDFVLPRSS